MRGAVERSLDCFARRRESEEGERWGSLVLRGRRRMGSSGGEEGVDVWVKVMGDGTGGGRVGFGAVAVAVVPDRRPRRVLVISKTWLR